MDKKNDKYENYINDIENLHKDACAHKRRVYADPEMGYYVFTEFYLKRRGYCCYNSCRHCPYSENGKLLKKNNIVDNNKNNERT